jgi:hypothetical protein
MHRSGVITLCLAAAACGGGGAASSDTATAFCSSYDQLWSQAEARCFGGTPADFAAGSTAFCGALDGLVAKGTIVFDHAKAADCLARAEPALAARCFGFDDCFADGVVGQLATGAPCVSPAECQPGSTCQIADAPMCTGKTCVPSPPPPPDDGLKEGAPCPVESEACSFFLTCIPDAPGATMGVCRVAGVGDPCGLAGGCPPQDYCADDNTCKPRLALGQPCKLAFHGCQFLAVCDPSSYTCVPAGRPGEPCGNMDFCASGACTQVSGVCEANLPTGSPCDADGSCASGACLNGKCFDCTP